MSKHNLIRNIRRLGDAPKDEPKSYANTETWTCDICKSPLDNQGIHQLGECGSGRCAKCREPNPKQPKPLGQNKADRIRIALDSVSAYWQILAILNEPSEDNYVAYCRYNNSTIVTCDSDAPHAFKVYRNPEDVEPDQPCGEYRKLDSHNQALQKSIENLTKTNDALEGQLDAANQHVKILQDQITSVSTRTREDIITDLSREMEQYKKTKTDWHIVEKLARELIDFGKDGK